MQITQLDKKQHNRKNFDCGTPALNEYLRQTARQHDELDLSRSYVLTEEEFPSDILGYYTLSVCNINWPELPANLQKKYPKQGISAALIGRLAIHEKKQRNGLGELLLIDAIQRVIQSSADVPLPVIVVDAKNEKAKAFYTKYGFEEIAPSSNRLYLPTKYAKEMLDEA